MITLNLNIPFIGLDGKPGLAPSPTQGQLLAQVLANQTKGNAIKHYEHAMALHQAKPLSLDTTDFDALRATIDATEMLPALSKGQLLLSLAAAKDAAK